MIAGFGESIVELLEEVVPELLEGVTDVIFESTALKNVPVISFIKAGVDVGIALRERALAKKALYFLWEVDKGNFLSTYQQALPFDLPFKESYFDRLNL